MCSGSVFSVRLLQGHMAGQGPLPNIAHGKRLVYSWHSLAPVPFSSPSQVNRRASLKVYNKYSISKWPSQ